jgi:hypothetical protein
MTRFLVPLLVASVSLAQLPAGFDTAKWPGKMSPNPEITGLIARLKTAQKDRDLSEMKKLIVELRQKMGIYAGVPEERPAYGKPMDSSKPDLRKIEKICWKAFEALKGRNGWDLAARAKRRGATQPRLRVSTREIMSDLRAAEADVDHADQYRAAAIDGLNYLVSQQTSDGAFGYPYDPHATSGLVVMAARIAREGQAEGKKMTENGWLIEDLGEGGLQFDNGEAGAALVLGYAMTGNAKYLDAARRAGDWATSRPLVLNWNYNSYSGALLAQLYRATGERKYLRAAIDKFEYGVLPGEMENGRWFDQHNAKPQYHALLCRNLTEYVLALEKAADPHASEAKTKTLRALDSMAAEINRYGASNAGEGLPLEALSLGSMAFGSHAAWDRAATIYVNYLVEHAAPEALDAGRPAPQTMTAYLLYRREGKGGARSCEVRLGACLAKRPQPSAATR